MIENKADISKNQRVLGLVKMAGRVLGRMKNKSESIVENEQLVEIEHLDKTILCDVAMQGARIENGVCQNGCQKFRLGGQPLIENGSVTSCTDGKNVAKIDVEAMVSRSRRGI